MALSRVGARPSSGHDAVSKFQLFLVLIALAATVLYLAETF
jgi:hypothetical protein